MKKNTCMDYLIQGEIVIIGAAEAAHLSSLLLKWSFSRCSMLFLGLAGAVCVLAAAALLLRNRKKRRFGGENGRGQKKEGRRRRQSGPQRGAERALFLLFAMILLSQLLYLCIGQNRYRQGDMTVETVGSFLAADGIYHVNPMTGFPFAEGIPLRLKILCLPTLYGSICRIFGLDSKVVVWEIVPMITLLSCYAAFASLGRCLFPDEGGESCGGFAAGQSAAGGKASAAGQSTPGQAILRRNRTGRLCFLIVVSLILWSGTYFEGMDGFQALYCGWRGTAIRNCVFLPWLLSLCLRRKWFSAVLCVLAEACMVWTLYGMGVCLLTAAGMAAAGILCRKFSLPLPWAEDSSAAEGKGDVK